MYRSLLVLLFAGAVACSDESGQEPLIILDPNNTNGETNNTTNNQTNNPTNNQTGTNNETNNFEPIDRPDVLELLDTSMTTGFNGTSVELDFVVPENTVSLMVVVMGTGPTYWTLGSWQNGDQTAVVTSNWLQADQGAPSLCLTCPQRIASAEGAFAALLPGNPNVSVKPGNHKISLYSFNLSGFNTTGVSSTAQVMVLAKVGASEPTQGVLDLNLWFTGAEGWTAQSAKTDERFQNILNGVGQIYQQANIRFGRISYNDVDGDFRVIENAGQPGSELTDLFEQSANAPFDGVNVFFVDELLAGGIAGGFGVILGISGGIPGPAGIMGTEKSGVAIAVKPNPQAPANFNQVMAHEMGHFLGLFHTSEQNFGFGAQIHDQMPDTIDNDTSFLMHNSGGGSTISPGQTRTMRLNPWVRQGDAE